MGAISTEPQQSVKASLEALDKVLNGLSENTVRNIPQRGNWVDNVHYVRQQIPGFCRIVNGTLTETEKGAVKELLGLKVVEDGTVSNSSFEGYLPRLIQDIECVDHEDSKKIADELSGILAVLRDNIGEVCVSCCTEQQQAQVQQAQIYYNNTPHRE